MPYFVYCKKCNADGSYTRVELKCTKCCGTGNDWREDRELATIHRSAGLSIDSLRQTRNVTAADGTSFFYAEKIPTVEAERKRVISFKEQENTIENDRRIKQRDLAARLHSFTYNFYLDDNTLNSYSEMLRGEIDRVSLYISFVGVNQSLLEKLQGLRVNIEKLTANNTNINTANLLKIEPDMIQMLEMQEMMSHEYFHLLQFLTCDSVNIFYKASRKQNIIRTHVLLEAIKAGLRLDLNSDAQDKSIFDFIPKFQVESVQNHFSTAINSARMETKIVRNFFDFKGQCSQFTIMDIFEGAAFAFQKLANRTCDIKTVFDKVDEQDSCYKRYFGAWKYFSERGGQERLIFFVIAYQSLKYGFLDDGDYMNIIPIPQDIFTFLCQYISKYEEFLNPKLTLTESRPLILPSILKDFNLSETQVIWVYKLKAIFNLVKEDIRRYSKKNGHYRDDTFDRKVVYGDNFMWSPLKALNEKILEDYPVFDSEYFWPLLLVNVEFHQEFIFTYLPELLTTTEFNGVVGLRVAIEDDNQMLKLVDDLDRYIRTGSTYCCDAHYNDMVFAEELNFCQSPKSLKNRYFIITGNDLDTLFNYEGNQK